MGATTHRLFSVKDFPGFDVYVWEPIINNCCRVTINFGLVSCTCTQRTDSGFFFFVVPTSCPIVVVGTCTGQANCRGSKYRSSSRNLGGQWVASQKVNSCEPVQSTGRRVLVAREEQQTGRVLLHLFPTTVGRVCAGTYMPPNSVRLARCQSLHNVPCSAVHA